MALRRLLGVTLGIALHSPTISETERKQIIESLRKLGPLTETSAPSNSSEMGEFRRSGFYEIIDETIKILQVNTRT